MLSKTTCHLRLLRKKQITWSGLNTQIKVQLRCITIFGMESLQSTKPQVCPRTLYDTIHGNTIHSVGSPTSIQLVFHIDFHPFTDTLYQVMLASPFEPYYDFTLKGVQYTDKTSV